jgi:hypothetical protein
VSQADSRLLHRRSEHGYTDRLAQAMPHEPEAISALEQSHLTDDAHRRASQRELDAWRRFLEIVGPELVELSRALDRGLASDLRALGRQLERIDRKLGDSAGNGRYALH